MDVNFKPPIRDDSSGMWRRVRLIQFDKKFDPHQEPHLKETLMAEAPGILAWAIRGAVDWFKYGLKNPPACILAATAAYEKEEDPVSEWLDTRTVRDAGGETRGSYAFADYSAWANESGLRPWERLTAGGFGKKLAKRFTWRKSGGKIFQGFSIKSGTVND